ncbi:MAG: 5,6-dimethylbenzimidazole synthase [Parvibaculaceae bacterium]|nr:5,6-dimethylbenzimidazole synthase [Parvibaculaceae bacterium]
MNDLDEAPPKFDAAFQDKLEHLIVWRRDVRRFRTDPVDPELVHKLLALADHAPSVGNSQPWRFVLVENAEKREGVRALFEKANNEALADYEGGKAALYARLKLAGLKEAPVHLAVFTDIETAQGSGLGRRTMPETLDYSAVTAVYTLWLAARAWDLGVGWVSIIDPVEVRTLLEVPACWHLVAYLCIGYPQEEHLDPELERRGWQARTDFDKRVTIL